MARTPRITEDALERLGAPTLAGVLVEHAATDSVLRKKLGIVLAGTEGAEKLSNEIENRIRTIGRSRSYVDWDRRKGLVQELNHLRTTISGTLAKQDPVLAAERMWEFVGIADSVLSRIGDGVDSVEDVFGEAMIDLGRICASLPQREPHDMARRVLAIIEGNDFSASGALIQHLNEALGPVGRAELRKATKAFLASLDKSGVPEEWRVDARRRQLAHRLALLADLECDVDGYIEAISAGRMETAYVTDIAKRLLAANRPAEALDRLKIARQIDEDDTTQIDLTVRALEALERNDEAQDVRWRFFEKTLNPDYLRAYLKRLPDFEDFEAEQKGLAWAVGHRSAERALAFFTAWPNLEMAARLVRTRLSDLNGAVYYVLRPSAEALEEKYPAAASLLYRRMVESVLNRGSSKQYPYATEDLQSCCRLAERVAGDDKIETHATFLVRLKKTHGRKYGFWSQFDGQRK